MPDNIDVDDVDTAADALLSKWKAPGDETSSPQDDAAPSVETNDDPPEEDKSEGTSETEDATADEQTAAEAAKAIASDDHEVEIEVSGEKRRIPVKDLKRLYGQEEALSRQTAEADAARQRVAAEAQRYQSGLDKLIKQAEQRWEPFSKIDFLVAGKNMSAEEFTQLRTAAKAAWDDYAFLKSELDAHTAGVQQQHQERFKELAKECIKALTDEKHPSHIPGWNQELYGELRTFAVAHGLSEQGFNSLVDPAALKLIHMASQFTKAQKVATEKVTKAPKNVAKTKNAGTGATPADVGQRKAMEKLRTSGATDDAADAFMARWGVKD